MYPMDYEEFRWALGDGVTVDLLREAYEAKRPLGDGVMRKLLRDFRLYMLVGGMPLEVKSSGYKSHASLDAFCKKFSARVGERFLVYTKDYRKDGATTLLPVVMTMML